MSLYWEEVKTEQEEDVRIELAFEKFGDEICRQQQKNGMTGESQRLTQVPQKP